MAAVVGELLEIFLTGVLAASVTVMDCTCQAGMVFHGFFQGFAYQAGVHGLLDFIAFDFLAVQVHDGGQTEPVFFGG